MVKPLPYLLLRLLVGMSLFGHGLIRLPKLQGFSAWMVKQFQNSPLPQELVTPFSYILPFAELVTGALLLAGLFTRYALVAGALIMITLIFGSSMIEDWAAIPSQLIHGFIIALLLNYIEANRFSADCKLKH
ncbi:DoxX family protein [Flavobacterium subsaxonicum]|uniref:DoxX family protein n=1 Tax=Flavobacterium subsaxonicum WB 4.1-42 = DSM 21790 TaxID=1121898 RepID=A0A0A2MIN3_9FLAO|nr:DoxX family membrane protein [Flavobacterium subsaxonicum]KGO91338.1 DoxX family protein [Flavobacterium subsaxonicum WB 4.1-42 = DSM 21790]